MPTVVRTRLSPVELPSVRAFRVRSLRTALEQRLLPGRAGQRCIEAGFSFDVDAQLVADHALRTATIEKAGQ